MISFLMMATAVFTQKDGERMKDKREKMEKLKIAFITEELNLSQEEAQKFWPIYNKKEENLREIRKEMKNEVKAAKDLGEEITDQEYFDLLDRLKNLRQQETEVMDKFFRESVRLLGSERGMALLDLDRKFKRQLKEHLGKDKDRVPRD